MMIPAILVSCSVTPWDPRPSGAHAWLDAPTLVASEGTLVGDVTGGQPDIRVGVHLRAAGPDPAGVRRLYQALVDVLVAVPNPWWLAEDVTPEQAGDSESYGYLIPLTTRRT